MSQKQQQNPLILRYHRLMDVFSKSDDERDFYVNKLEGFIIYLDLSKSQKELDKLTETLEKEKDQFCLVSKFTFYETKKIMEGFINEKVYDIDTKEKLADLIQSRDSKELFLEFLYDHHHELEKWQQYYQERSRVRIIEWLRLHEFDFVFEEDLEMATPLVEKVKRNLFEAKVSKDLATARQALKAKAKTYYSNEALNPRPKRGRPPKQVVKVEVEPQFSLDIYSTVTPTLRPFLYVPDISSASSITFSSKYENQEDFLASLKNSQRSNANEKLEELSKRLASLQDLSMRLAQEGYEADLVNDAGSKDSSVGRAFVPQMEASALEAPVSKKEPTKTTASATKKKSLEVDSKVKEEAKPKKTPKKRIINEKAPKATTVKKRLRTLTKKEDKPKRPPVRRLRKAKD